ncbi:MAG: hypothetical protein HOP12_04310 [Candidatus Eisenbacteria bacterium]|uniref:Heme-copper oxidase subunit III family profile domain-containing protein n=1 Tax=Eiseniibacteriota bacterium TaxID=2212470 RepID=A0A849SKK9_UNCEI|nr:hypothetical protein [Candidatus Eisenbacteria bacterium]
MSTSMGSAIEPARRAKTDQGVFGMALVVFVEVMLFAGFLSAYMIARSSVAPGLWPPPDQPRLPVERTLLNTAALIVSGIVLYLTQRAATRRGIASVGPGLFATLAFGAFFVGFQGIEWAGLLRQGFTLTSSQLGAFFYVIIGAHALHAVAALIGLVACVVRLRAARLTPSFLGAAALFWYFVVAVWPFLYWQVYL